jgi:cell surface protein SprA
LTKIYTIIGFGFLAGLFVLSPNYSKPGSASAEPLPLYTWASDSLETDSVNFNDSLPYPFEDSDLPDFFDNDEHSFDMDGAGGIETSVSYDPVTGEYVVTESIGGQPYRTSSYSFDEFLERESQKSLQEYWQERSQAGSLFTGSGVIPSLGIENEFLCRLFGGCTVDIRPSGNIDLSFGGSFQNIENPILTVQQRRQGGFDFDMNINMSVLGKIGEKLKLTTNYNTQATFDFENQVKLEFTGDEDDIFQSIEAGNVSLPLNSSLIPGTQSLFGFKTKMQFGRLSWTSLMSQQRSQTQSIQIQNGAQTRTFEVYANEYDVNRHFFLGHYFRENYESWLSTLPFINSPININRVEVWVTNTTGATINTRDIVGFADLGEADSIFWDRDNGGTINSLAPGSTPNNYANDLYQDLVNNSSARDLNGVVAALTNPGGTFKMEPVRDFEKTRGRKLAATEYTLNSQLGFISINTQLQPDDVLAIAYEYTLNGETIQVGEFTDELPPNVDTSNVVFLKLLKPTSNRTDLPIWDLMMKNVYSFGGFQISAADFQMQVLYQDPGGGFKRYIPADNSKVNGLPLITLLNLDRLNNNNDPQPDGIFDFVSGITILPNTGRIIFPVLEPFGDHLRNKFVDENGNPDPEAESFVFDKLYDETQTIALQFPQFNRFVIQGSYQSSVSSEIYLGTFNLPRGSVTVTAGGQLLTENVDYTVDYSLGRVKIINESILNSGLPIDVNYENNALIAFQQKTLMGSRFDYWISDDFTLGATILRLSERPFTQKVNIGDDPIKNRMIGFDLNYSTEAPWLTRALDKLPLYDTKETSTIAITAEAANFSPGHSGAIGKGDEGTIFLDDFEGSRSAYDLKFPFIAWELASTPAGARDGNDRLLFPEADQFDNVDYGKNRALMNWYTIDPLFLQDNAATPDHITNADQSSNFVRQINETEIFPQAQFQQGTPTLLATFDLAYYPETPGPYNFEVNPTGFSAGLNADGTLRDPKTRWGGIMRDIETNDFEAANIEFVEFWVLDPYVDSTSGDVFQTPTDAGELYINLGNISEDVLKDSRMFFENGLPQDGDTSILDRTNWGLVPRTQPVTNAFDNDPDTRDNQDKGFDGLNNEEEVDYYSDYLNELDAAAIDPAVIGQITTDPARDDYHYYRGDDYDAEELPIIDRYQRFNNPQGNSPVSAGSDLDFATSATNLPNSEDLNRDFTLNETEAYFAYRVPIFEGMNTDNHPYVTSVVEGNRELQDGTSTPYRWLQFKVPVLEYDQKVGNIADFRSVRFVRMFMTGFEEPIILRFARLELVRNQWRRYQFSLLNPGEYLPDDASNETDFAVSSVSLEENSDREPIPYTLPPDAIRESIVAGPGTSAFLQNEQALSMTVCPLADGDARAIFKDLNIDLRRYRRMLMDVHAEQLLNSDPAFYPEDGDLTLFLRLGTDFTENFYEIEIPLILTDPDDPIFSQDPAGVSEADIRDTVWRNRIDIALSRFVNLKRDRNAQGISPFVPFEEITFDEVFPELYERLTIIGNPDLGYVEQVMIGIRNPKEEVGSGQSYCTEVWVNELRLSDIDERGGWAALARMDAKLADLGSLTASANMHTRGFGTLEQQINERYMDDFWQYDVALSLELGRFFPKEWGVRLPMYASINESFSTPEFDPYTLDIELDPTLDLIRDTFGGDSATAYKRSTQNVNSIKSLNFTNMRIERDRKGKKPKPWNIENFDFTYAYSVTEYSDPIIESDQIVRHKGALSYNFAGKPLYIEPFKKAIPRSSKYLQIIRDLNFNPVPNSYSFRTEINRQFGETLQRDIYGDGLIDPTFDKYFTWDRNYTLRWDLTRSIKFDFTAANSARIDEPFGRIDTDEKRDTLWGNFLDFGDPDKNGIFGRNISYRHTLGLNYTVPFKKIPILDWITVKASYDASVTWTAGSLGIADTLGHILGNTQNRSLNSEFNLRNLYNKSGFLKPYNSSARGGSNGGFGKWGDSGGDADDWGFGSDEESDEEEDEEGGSSALTGLADVFFRIVLGVKRVSVNYSQNYTTTIPGYMPTPQYVGLTTGSTAPGVGFIAGMQPDQAWLFDAAAQGWISTSTSLNQLFLQNYTENLSIKGTVEPYHDLRIDLNVDRTFTQNHSEFFRNTNTNDNPIFESQNPQDAGSFNISFIAWSTLFDGDLDSNDVSVLFNELEANRVTISNRLGELNPYSEGAFSNPNDTSGINLAAYAEGYGPYSQDVLIPAFLAAYSGKDANEVGLDIFKTMPVPNWRVTYSGLGKIEVFKKWFSSFNVEHGYTSTLSVNSYNTDLDFNGNYFLYGNVFDTISGNFVSIYNVPNIVLSEQLSPLIGIDFTTTNDITANFSFKKSRTLSMSFIDYQLSENRSTEFTIGAGYKMTDFQLPFKFRGQRLRLENDLTFRFDMSFRDDLITNYRLDQDLAEPTGGVRMVTVSPTVDYVVNNQLKVQLFFNRTRNVPKISSSFPVTTTDAGLRIQFTLTE